MCVCVIKVLLLYKSRGFHSWVLLFKMSLFPDFDDFDNGMAVSNKTTSATAAAAEFLAQERELLGDDVQFITGDLDSEMHPPPPPPLPLDFGTTATMVPLPVSIGSNSMVISSSIPLPVSSNSTFSSIPAVASESEFIRYDLARKFNNNEQRMEGETCSNHYSTRKSSSR